MGVSRIKDARILAQRGGLHPDRWQDVRQVLPRLSEADWFATLKHGYARGFEAQQLVDNVRNYYDTLARLEPRDAAPLPVPELPDAEPVERAARATVTAKPY